MRTTAASQTPTWSLQGLQVTGGTNVVATATVTLVDAEGHAHTDAAIGDGPIDAAYSAIQRLTDCTPVLMDYQIRAITGGKDALGEVRVEIRSEQQVRARGRGTSTDIIEASARAYLAAINRLTALEGGPKPDARMAQP